MNLPENVRENLLSLGARLEDHFLVAVSGGSDSTALLLAMRNLLGKGGTLTAAHLDHGVREESVEDARKVLDLCVKLDVPLIQERLDALELESERRKHGSREAGMRVLRYRFLEKAADVSGSRWILTGHTQDDQEETVLFRALRGMDWRSLGSIPGKRDSILRPLINVPREATMYYCRSMGISALTDPSNLDTSFTRSRIRNLLLPALSSGFNQGISCLLRRLGQAAARLELAEGKILAVIMEDAASTDTGTLHTEKFKRFPELLRRGLIIKFLYSWLNRYPSSGLVDEVLDFVAAGRNGQLSLPGGLILNLTYGFASVRERSVDPAVAPPSEIVELTIPGRVYLQHLNVVLTADYVSFEEPGRYPALETVLISRNSIEGGLWVRNRLEGDRFMPLGMNRDKKLKDFLVDRKILRERRDQIPLVLSQSGVILWVAGIEISQKAALRGEKGEGAVKLTMISPVAGTDAGA